MSRLVSFNRLAEAELREAIGYYESESSGLGRRFLTTVESALADILDHPMTARHCAMVCGANSWVASRINMLYRLDDEEVRILAVMHKRRRPLYWAERG